MDNKFLVKNKENIDKFNKFIDDNIDRIYQIHMSCEMYEFIKLLPECKVKSGFYIRYKTKKIIRMKYYPAKLVNFSFKENAIKFKLPCVCGIWNDEIHP